MNKKYRTPSLDEFIQDFEFEYLDIHTYRYIIIDFSDNNYNSKNDKTPWKHIKTWKSIKLWWKYPPNELIVTKLENGGTLTQTGRLINFFCPWNDNRIQEMIRKKQIRVKINNNN